ncbi:MAG TPA: alanine--tRNA ligase [Gaiellaceae bacterium]|nr:alanine--tRNA ligase [Gaiellaceae bacterium]
MRTTAELREGFLSFFEEKGHRRLPSWSLVPRADDHSTLLTTAGMQPQMPYFLGREQPPAPLTTTAQKCFRTPDIDEVGLDGHHLTFFEMLGNFSFGRYFKQGAVEYATEFVQERLGVPWDRIWVTVHAGDPELGLGEDETAVELWKSVGMPRERIVGLPSAENFWSVGGPGPCGPDSEIYWDWGEEHGCGDPSCAPACHRCDRFLEFWNLVFMEYELHADGTLTLLPEQNVDTGLGLERTAAILQGVRSVYETDGYQAIMSWIEAESGVCWDADERAAKAHRILADHGRGMTALVGDGVTPSNEGRGYVLRRIIRRAVQQARAIGLDDLWRLTDVVVDQMGPWYPELPANRERIREVVRAEEERFTETLSRGMRLFEEVASKGAISGRDAFDLTATYGFPVELTRELARERGLAVDEDEFGRLMKEHREISRAGGAGEAQRAAEFARAAGFETLFVGYEKTDVLTQIGALEELGDGTFLAMLRESPFYAEGGGQVTDAGWIEKDGTRAELEAAFRFGGDQALVFRGEGFASGDRVRAVVPWKVRFPTMANHTATHLLHKALRTVLGEHVRQAGSAVRPDKLRFDFTHGGQLSEEERDRVEELVNGRIFENLPVHAFETPIAEAERLGAMMLFGEKYGDVVRVVEIGSGGDAFSRELCGGTHVRTTAEIGPFAILSESSVGSGVRRIEAVTSGEAYALLRAGAEEAEELRGELAAARKEAKRRPAAAPEAAAGVLAELLSGAKEAAGVRVVTGEAGEMDAEALLELSDRVKQKAAPAAVVLGARDDGRVHLVANFDASLPERGLNASEIVKEAAGVVGGGGGGRPTMARAGGRDPEKLAEALAAAERAILAALT